jgi:predicted membrane protein
MDATILTNVVDALPRFEGYAYPNERSLHPLWSVLIVVYPYVTGLVAAHSSWRRWCGFSR